MCNQVFRWRRARQVLTLWRVIPLVMQLTGGIRTTYYRRRASRLARILERMRVLYRL